MRGILAERVGQRLSVMLDWIVAKDKMTPISRLDVMFPYSLFTDIAGSEMKKINVVDFYNFGRWMAHLSRLDHGPLTQETVNVLHNARAWLELVSSDKETHIIPFEACLPSAKRLFQSVDAIWRRFLTVPGSETSAHELHDIRNELHTFETVFANEVPLLAIYFVSQKRNYSTRGLIEHADNEFPKSVKDKLSAQTIIDIKAAGKCIAFELGTASGAHSFRALEAVALDYIQKRNLESKLKGIPGLGSYFDALLADGANNRAIEIGHQLRKRRNPLMHPTDNYNVDEAIEAFQLCTSAITALVQDMESRGLFPMQQPPLTSTS